MKSLEWIHIPLNKYCMKRVIWQLPYGSSREFWSKRLQNKHNPSIAGQQGPSPLKYEEKTIIIASASSIAEQQTNNLNKFTKFITQ